MMVVMQFYFIHFILSIQIKTKLMHNYCLMPILFVMAFEEGVSPLTELERRYQQIAMDNFLMISCQERQHDLTKRGLLPRAQYANKPCMWRGVLCKKGHILWIVWVPKQTPEVEIQYFDPNWLPKGVKKIRISGHNSNQTFSTNTLPQSLRIIQLDSCNLHGSLDLTILPAFLTELLLQDNNLHGIVRLVSLPDRLSRINLSANNFQKLIVQNASIPDFISEYNFRNMRHESTKRFEVVCLDSKAVRKNIRI